jgi:arginine/lysine/ornithine decarboxylase
MTIKYIPIVPEDPPEDTAATKWSQGIAMFAAFVIPFVLLLTSARYRVFIAQANHKLQSFTQSSQVDQQLKDVKLKKVNNAAP